MTRSRNIQGAIVGGVLAAGLMFIAVAPRADDKDPSKVAAGKLTKATDPETCIKEAAKMNNATIRFSELAAQKAQSPELKRFAQTLEQDHRKAQTDLEAIA